MQTITIDPEEVEWRWQGYEHELQQEPPPPPPPPPPSPPPVPYTPENTEAVPSRLLLAIEAVEKAKATLWLTGAA
eukprot:4967888-Prymnesium_polylepis.1